MIKLRMKNDVDGPGSKEELLFDTANGKQSLGSDGRGQCPMEMMDDGFVKNLPFTLLLLQKWVGLLPLDFNKMVKGS